MIWAECRIAQIKTLPASSGSRPRDCNDASVRQPAPDEEWVRSLPAAVRHLLRTIIICGCRRPQPAYRRQAAGFLLPPGRGPSASLPSTTLGTGRTSLGARCEIRTLPCHAEQSPEGKTRHLLVLEGWRKKQIPRLPTAGRRRQAVGGFPQWLKPLLLGDTLRHD